MFLKHRWYTGYGSYGKYLSQAQIRHSESGKDFWITFVGDKQSACQMFNIVEILHDFGWEDVIFEMSSFETINKIKREPTK